MTDTKINQPHDENGDVFNATKMCEKFCGSLLFSPHRKQWMFFVEGRRWHWDELRHVTQNAIGVTQDLLQDAGMALIKAGQILNKEMREAAVKRAEGMLKHAKASQNKGKLDAMVALSATNPMMTVGVGQLDRDDHKLGVGNGIVELKTGHFREGRPDDFVTKHSVAEWKGGVEDVTCLRWQQFLLEIIPDADTRNWLHRFAGYCLSGSTEEQIFVVMHGHGANGKSVFVEMIKTLLGDYATTARFETFCEQKQAGIRNDLAALDKVRLVVANEGADGARLDEGVVKLATGGDEIRARFLYGEEFSFKPRFKLLLVSNHKPVIKGTDLGIWRRIVLVPFSVTIPPEKRDRRLHDNLLAELPGILAWAVDGYGKWQESGLSNLPPEIMRANLEYRKDSDVLGKWLEECCAIDPQSFCVGEGVRKSYKTWADMYGFGELNDTNLANKLKEKGFMNIKKGGERGWQGFKIISASMYSNL